MDKNKKFIVYNENAGCIVFAENVDDAIKKANETYLSAFRTYFKKSIFKAVQAYENGKNYGFNLGNDSDNIFDNVQFLFNGEGGNGNFTYHNKKVNTKPTKEQLKFMGKSTVYAIRFWNNTNELHKSYIEFKGFKSYLNEPYKKHIKINLEQ